MQDKLFFASDYQEGAHPAIIERLVATNLEKSPGYGTDSYSESARNRIREACECPGADVHFLVGGTQMNAIVITSILKPYQGVISAKSGHIATHEAGAIEVGGHKVLEVPEHYGKVHADEVEALYELYLGDGNRDHLIMPGMVYISQPTEYGTLYSLSELEALRKVCDKYNLPLYVDGARLAYALACESNDVSLADMARLCDAFYIGGTKCGLLFGEALVVPNPELLPHFFTITKQRGALLAKGRILGVQYDTIFTDGLYEKVGKNAIDAAERIKEALDSHGYVQAFPSPTNQIFVIMDDAKLDKLAESVKYSFWEKPDENHTIIRLATSWATTEEDVDKLIELL